jgi:predicted nucleic acid-binding protein
MSRVFWDTNLFIYLFENYGVFSKAVAQLRSKMLERGDQLLTSTLTLGEILVKPIERNDP